MFAWITYVMRERAKERWSKRRGETSDDRGERAVEGVRAEWEGEREREKESHQESTIGYSTAMHRCTTEPPFWHMRLCIVDHLIWSHAARWPWTWTHLLRLLDMSLGVVHKTLINKQTQQFSSPYLAWWHRWDYVTGTTWHRPSLGKQKGTIIFILFPLRLWHLLLEALHLSQHRGMHK